MSDSATEGASNVSITFGSGANVFTQQLTVKQVLALSFLDTFRSAIIGDFVDKVRAEFASHPEAVPSCFLQNPLDSEDRQFFIDAIDNFESSMNKFLNEFGQNHSCM